MPLIIIEIQNITYFNITVKIGNNYESNKERW